MKRFLWVLALCPVWAHADLRQPGIINGSAAQAATFNVSSGTVTTFYASTATITNMVGQTTSASAPAGDIGEIKISSVSSDVLTITSAQAVSVGTVTLTAGCWEIQAVACAEATNVGTTVSNISACIATTANTAISPSSGLPQDLTGQTGMAQVLSGYVLGNAGSYCLPTSVTHACISSSTPYYGTCRVTFAVSTADCYGGIQARREK